MSVSGIRGIVGETITPQFIGRIAFIQTKLAGGKKIVVGRDTRPSGLKLAQAVFQGIRAGGGYPIDIGIAPTPTTCVAVKTFNAGAGIILTASHNPLPYNGYKMVHAGGRLCTGEECEEVYARFRAGDYISDEVLANQPEVPCEEADPIGPHIDAICNAIDIEAIRNAHLKIGVDAINGAANAIIGKLLRRLGVEWVGMNTELSGNFTHNPEPRPEHLTDFAKLLQQTPELWGGFAFDPDADRLATMGEKGEPISEELTLALALRTILAKNKTDIATNLSTSMVIDDVAREFGVKVFRTKIGEANVVAGMQQHGCGAGGEGNGGVIYPPISTVRDGPAALALICELMALHKKKLTQLVSQLRQYPLVKEKIMLGDKNPTQVLGRLSAIFSKETVDTQDGLKIIREYGWVHVRASNTEPILRCYAEAQTPQQARALADMVITLI
jgi:phosphomannomutase